MITDDDSKDLLGDRMKDYERVETGRCLDASLPIYARIDGRGFSKFTRGLRRPYDERLSTAMIETTRHLVKNTHAMLGYTQSDEISLGWHIDLEANPRAQMFFVGKVQKLASILAGMATAAFTQAVLNSDSEFAAYAEKLPHFDARVCNVPSAPELANMFLWRELDASRNAIQMVAHHHFSHKELHGISTRDLVEKLREHGIVFEELPDFFKRGTFVRQEKTRSVINADGEESLRSQTVDFNLPRLLDIQNRTDVIYGAAPILV